MKMFVIFKSTTLDKLVKANEYSSQHTENRSTAHHHPKHLDLTNTSGKGVGYKVNTQNPAAFLCNNEDHAEKEIRKRVPSTMRGGAAGGRGEVASGGAGGGQGAGGRGGEV